jgi:hypothetical protein
VDEWSSEKNSAFLKDWFRKHWPAAKSLLDQLPEGRRYQAYLFAANAIWETQPDLAMQFAADVFANKNDPEGHVLEGLLSQEIERVGSDNLAQWLLQAVPTSSTRDSVLGRVFRDWGQKDPAAAEKWIAARENQTGADINQLDTPKYTLCSVVAPKDPAKAIWLAQGINNEHLQQSALISFVGRWLDGDIKQGLTALHAAGFQPDEIQSLLQMAKDRDND